MSDPRSGATTKASVLQKGWPHQRQSHQWRGMSLKRREALPPQKKKKKEKEGNLFSATVLQAIRILFKSSKPDLFVTYLGEKNTG